MVIKANKEIRQLIYHLCNGIRRQKDICDYLMTHHNEFTDTNKTEKTVEYHLNKLKQDGFIYIKFNGRIIDLER